MSTQTARGVAAGQTDEERIERYLTLNPDFFERHQPLLARMNTENVAVTFVDGGVRRIAEIAFSVNEKTENIGARRLHTVMERLLESVSFDAAENGGSAIEIDAKYVDEHLGNLAKDEDLSRYIL